jgi:hypothetical protein
MREKDSFGLDPIYDHPRAVILFGLPRIHNITVDYPEHREKAMDFELRHESKSIRLSLHESTGKKGFWGIGQASVDYLNQVDRWLLVLLLLRKDRHMADGWLISKQQWTSLIPSISMDRKANYKINRHILINDDKLSGMRKILEEIVRYVKSK